ncbi:MAG TPA: CAP domain-containing protein [Candidatus Limnocylindrales bacterium]|nr:CAP domain-containing protein [Candidatus Limnocylindrales bacterium]
MALTAPPKRTHHHKKTKGQHHRHGKHYLKTYMPYLPLLLAVIVGLAINSLWTSRSAVLGAQTNLSAQTLLQSSNIERSRHQADDLRISQELSVAAQAKAQDMVTENYWAHTSPDGRTPWSFIKSSGYSYRAAGENLAFGFSNAPSIMTGWMNSTEHRKNLLNADFQEVGYGIATADNFNGHGRTTVIVALFATPTDAVATSGLASAATTDGTASAAGLRPVSRIQLMTGGQAPWSFTLVAAASLLGLILVVYRHARIWHRVIVGSESFVIHHKLLDVVVVSFSVAGYVLTRAAGYI